MSNRTINIINFNLFSYKLLNNSNKKHKLYSKYINK